MPTILVVDDSKFGRNRIIQALRDESIDCMEAANGEEALVKVDECRPDLLVSDLLMPVLDGFSLIRALRLRGNPIPVIVISADIQTTSREISTDLGVSAFLNKPFQPADLVAAVRHALLTIPEVAR